REQEATEQILRVRPRQAGHRLDAIKDRAPLVELRLLLREVRWDDAVPELPLEQRREQGRLAGSVRADERNMLASIDGERHVGEQLLVSRRHVQPAHVDDDSAAPRRIEELEAERSAVERQR